ncbi:hypothetical protein RLDS_16810 [Sphingobium lactosutens DS20]|uniref:Uncharacterized protein n=1 Tax=Sphingobium lactosutens DS20 TaxID=1331060 RepID=T0IUQ7_9SPHN|nr:hypothetical protein RLDS_16810 [Sphingobium lactosutens DS20]
MDLINLPGHGPGSHSHSPSAYADLAGSVATRLPDVFDAVGFSLGSKVLLDLAIRFPGRIRRLVLGGVGDNVFARESVADAAADALEGRYSGDVPAPVSKFISTFDVKSNDRSAVAAVLRRPPNPLFKPDDFKNIIASVLLVNGTEDPIASNAEQLVSSLRPAQVIWLKGVGHFDLPATPGFREAAAEFLQAQVPQDDQEKIA